MKRMTILFVAAAFAGTGSVAMSEMKMDMKAMDKSGDGMISKSEFMNYHEAMFDKMKKDGKGMVSMKDMQMMMGGDMMKGDGMKKDGAMMKDGAMKDGMKSK